MAEKTFLKILLLSIVLDTSFIICVTRAAMYFNNPKILWWYLLVLIIGYSFKR